MPGRYTITVTAAGIDRDHYPIRFAPEKGPVIMGFGVKQAVATSVSSKSKLLKTFALKDDVDQTFQFDVWIDKDHFPYFSFVNGSGKPITQVRSNIRRRRIPSSAMKQPYRGPGIRISKERLQLQRNPHCHRYQRLDDGKIAAEISQALPAENQAKSETVGYFQKSLSAVRDSVLSAFPGISTSGAKSRRRG